MKKRKKLPKAKQQARWEAHLDLRAKLFAQVSQCVAGTGDCSSICSCIGNACKCVGVGYVPMLGTLSDGASSK